MDSLLFISFPILFILQQVNNFLQINSMLFFNYQRDTIGELAKCHPAITLRLRYPNIVTKVFDVEGCVWSGGVRIRTKMKGKLTL